jgi:hypothetical protein
MLKHEFNNPEEMIGLPFMGNLSIVYKVFVLKYYQIMYTSWDRLAINRNTLLQQY